MKAVEYIPYTLYKGTFIDTPCLGEIRIRFDCVIGVNQQGVVDYISDLDPNQPDFDPDFDTEEGETKEGDTKDGETIDTKEADIKMFIESYKGYDRVRHHFNYVVLPIDQFFFPGFIDTHIHASQYPNCGIGLNIQLLDWLKIYTFPLENSFNESNLKLTHEIYSKVIEKTLTNGTTCASYFTTIDEKTSEIFGDLLLKFGQRGFVGKVCMDHNTDYESYQESETDCLNNMEKLIKFFENRNPDGEDLVKPIITPRFAPVCTRDLLTKLGKLSSSKNLPIQTHISENKGEIELVKKLFPECSNYAEVYDNHDLLQETTILAHAVHLTNDECKLIKNNNCSISHCPTSNTFIASGEAPVKNYLYNHKINVSLGTDVSGGWDCSILSIIRQSILVLHHLSMKLGNNFDKLSLNDSLFMATQGGAIAVGLQDKIGSFDLNKKFDAQLINLNSGNLDLFNWQKINKLDNLNDKRNKFLNLLNKWVFCGDDRNCIKVYVNGRKVIDKR